MRQRNPQCRCARPVAALALSRGAIVAVACVFAAISIARAASPATTRASRDSNEIRRGMEMGGDPEERRRQFYERIIGKIEPSMHGDLARLPQYLELFKRELVGDARVFAFDVAAEASGDRAVLTGCVEFTENKAALADFFKQLNLPIEDRTELLPGAALGEQRFGIVSAERAFIYDKPAGRRETLTECLRDEVVYLLTPDGDHFLCHAPSGYVGYIAADAIRRVDASQLDAYLADKPPRHAKEIETVIATAQKYMGTKYVWGGITSDGIDCSGLVFISFRAIGIQLPRDADQQALVGTLVATRWHRSAMRRGDLMYFLGRRGNVHHTAIYLGDNKYIEAADGGVKITSFDTSDAYSEKRTDSFCFAKRVLD